MRAAASASGDRGTVALWPPAALGAVRLLILGGEACPPELAARLARDGREVWNTYGPTEATVVACAARLDGGPTAVRLRWPLHEQGAGCHDPRPRLFTSRRTRPDMGRK